MHELNPYTLIPSSVMVFLGFLLLLAWRFTPHQRALVWMAMGILLTSVPMAIQSVLPPADIAHYAIYTAVPYLAGAWAVGRSMAEKFHTPYPWRWGVLVALLALWGLYYFSRVEENLTVRSYVLSAALGLLHALPMGRILRRKPPTERLDIWLYWTYLVFCVYTAARPLSLLVFEQVLQGALITSVYWVVTLTGTILFAMAFAFLMLAACIRTTMRQLQAERDLDPLTQLLNRRAFEESVHERLSAASTPASALVMGDIDHFKRINDAWGHAYGDRVLRDVAQCLQHHTRSFDVVGRYGGEEFVLLLPHTTTTVACQIAQRIQEQLHHGTPPLPDGRTLSISFGVAAVHRAEDFHAALKRADAELYKAKQAGRDRIYVAQEVGLTA